MIYEIEFNMIQCELFLNTQSLLTQYASLHKEHISN